MRGFSFCHGRRKKPSSAGTSHLHGLSRYYRKLTFQALEPRQLKAANVLNTPLTWIAQNGTLAPLDQNVWQLAAPPSAASQNALASWQNLLAALSTQGSGGAFIEIGASTTDGYGGSVGGPGQVVYIDQGATLQLTSPLADGTVIAGQGALDLDGQHVDNSISLVGFAGTLTNSSGATAELDGAIGGGSFSITGNGNIDLEGVVVGACWTKSSENTLTLGGADYAGALDIEAGTVQLNSPAALTSGQATINGGQLDLAGQNATLDSLQGYGGAVSNSGATAALTINSSSGAANYHGTVAGNVLISSNGYGGSSSGYGGSSSGYGGSSSGYGGSSSGYGGSSGGYGGSSSGYGGSSSGYGGSSSGYGGSSGGYGGSSSGYGGSSSGYGGSSSGYGGASSGYAGSSSGYGGSSSGYGGAPQISDFSWQAGPDFFTFTGTVSDPNQNSAGLTVTFGGVLAGQSTTVGSDGTFSYSTTIPNNTSGTVTAQTTDSSGHTSNLAMDDVSTVRSGYGGSSGGSGNGYGGSAGSGQSNGYGGASGSSSGEGSSSSGTTGSSNGYGGSASGNPSNGYGGESSSSNGYGGVLNIQPGQTYQLNAPLPYYTTIEGSGTLDLNGQSLNSSIHLYNFSGTVTNSSSTAATIAHRRLRGVQRHAGRLGRDPAHRH